MANKIPSPTYKPGTNAGPVAPPVPWQSARHTKIEVCAVQAVANGNATPDQQRQAMAWIINEACRTYDLAYRTDPHDHAFCTGRMFAGQQIVGALDLVPAVLPDV